MNTTQTRAQYYSVAETAKLVRAALKESFARKFPGVKFSVRSRSYAGGASIDITWTDGPTEKDVDAAVSRYKGADFDGMQDLKTYNHEMQVTETGEVIRVRYGADFIHGHRRHSRAFLEAAVATFMETYRSPFEVRIDGSDEWGWYVRLVHDAARGDHGTFIWQERELGLLVGQTEG